MDDRHGNWTEDKFKNHEGPMLSHEREAHQAARVKHHGAPAHFNTKPDPRLKDLKANECK